MIGASFTFPVVQRRDLLAVLALSAVLLCRAAIVPSEPRRTAWMIDVLVSNAEISGANKPTHELSEEEWDSSNSQILELDLTCSNLRRWKRGW